MVKQSIHPTAVLHPELVLPQELSVGAYAVIDENVILGEGCDIRPNAHIYPNSELGKECVVYDGAIVGSDPQDKKYHGENSYLKVGDRTIIREYCTINRGTGENGVTTIGSNVLLMSYCHVGHDCIIEEGVVISNHVQIGGHVHIQEHAVIGGVAGIHQFTRIGAYSFIAGALKIDRDVLPYSRVLGYPAAWGGINKIALHKHGLDSEVLESLRFIFKNSYFNGAPLEPVLENLSENKIAKELLNFLKNSKLGVLGPRLKNN